MSQRYPCPNPVCTYEFSAAEISTGAATVTCPVCGLVIHLRAPQPAPAAVPMARPAAAAQPVAEPATPIVRVRRRGSRDWLTYGLLLGFLILMAGLGVVGLMVHSYGGFTKLVGGGGMTFKSSDFNFTYETKAKGWESNEAMKSQMGSDTHVVLMRSETPQAYLAIAAVDYKDHNPSPRELDNAARQKLKALFPANLETTPGPGEPPASTDPVAQQTAHRIEFFGKDSEDKQMRGEVIFFANQGIGYWLYMLAPDEASFKQLADEFKDLRQGLTLLGERSAWAKIQSQRHIFEGSEIKGYQLIDTTGRWKKDDDPKAHDPEADLVLRALDPTQPRKPTLGADVIVMSLKPSGDPVELAHKHILAKHERDAYPGTKIDDAGGDGTKDRVGEAKGHLLRWRIDNGDGRLRFAVVGIVPRDDDVLVLYGECAWDRRFNWELQLQQLIESLQLK